MAQINLSTKQKQNLEAGSPSQTIMLGQLDSPGTLKLDQSNSRVERKAVGIIHYSGSV